MNTNKPPIVTPVQASGSAASALSQLRTAADNEVVITRVMNAPRELVFAMWLSHEHLARWYGPEGFTITTHEIDVRTGGLWRFTMHGPDGIDYGNRVVYSEITQPERIAYRHSGEGSTESIQFETVATFIELGDKTELVLKSIFPNAAERDAVVKMSGAIEGGQQTLGRLAQYVESAAQSLIAPR